MGDLSSVPTCLGIMFYADGLQLTRSMHSKFWPILGQTEHSNGNGVFLSGCYHGHSKPQEAEDYLKEFVQELNDLLPNRFSFARQAFMCIFAASFVMRQ